MSTDSSRRVPEPLRRHVEANNALSWAALVGYALNRGYAYWSSTLNALNYGFLYLFAGGLAPSYHTRADAQRGYAPAVFVTGAHDGIGRAIAFELAKSGYTVFAGVRRPEDGADLEQKLDEFAESIGRQPWKARKILGAVRPVVCDVLDRESIAGAARDVARACEEDGGRPLVGLVNNAGFCMISPMELTRREDITRMIDMDWLAYVDVTRAFFPLLKRSKGRVVMIGSYGGYAAVPGWTTYNGVKAAIEHMTRAWSLETTHTLGIRMTTVRPGFVASAGIGPDRIARAIDGYEADPHAAGFDSLGNVLAAEARAEKDGDAGAAAADAMRPYRGMMASNAKMLRMGVAGAAQPAFNVARTVKDALTEPWMQPVYTAGVDALIGQAIRDLVPEPFYEYMQLKTF